MSLNCVCGFFFRERNSIIYVEFKTGEFNALLFGLLLILDGQQKPTNITCFFDRVV